ncbi:MAG: hypothetical protein ACTSYI_16390 [Promethearchaeota archaeon]
MNAQMEDKFLNTMWEVLSKEAMIIKTQKIRLKELLTINWKGFDFGIAPLDDFTLEKVPFYSDIEYRIQILSQLNSIFFQTKDAIVRIVEILVVYYPDSENCANTFSGKDQVEKEEKSSKLDIRYTIAEKFIGSLLPIIKWCSFHIDLDLLIFGTMKPILTLTGLTTSEIHEKLLTYGKSYSLDEVSTFLSSYQDKDLNSFLKGAKTDDGEINWTLQRSWELSEKSQNIFDSTVGPIINWAIGSWRSMYNLRELDTPIPDNYPQASGLREVLSRAATQGFHSASDVITNLIQYYKFIHPEKS